ncbi:hypothetical protein ACEPAG_8256 [Sanghuangporus baumii]
MEQLHLISELMNLDHFKQAIRDIVLVHHFLFRSKVRILHCDISLHSLMVRYNDNGTVQGVLIDFDLASVGKPGGEGHHGRRTGTRRFMAIDLLEKETPPHLERFDWESLFYVICWIGTHYSNGTEIQTTALETWDADDDETLSLVKHSVLAGLKPNLGILFTDFYKPLFSLWIQDMQSMFRAANLEKTKFEIAKAANPDPEEDTLVFHETLGNHVTWDKFWQILEK